MPSPLDKTSDALRPEPVVDVDGVAIPLSMCVEAVRRCTEAILTLDRFTRERGFATAGDLAEFRAILTGEAADAADDEDA